MINCTGSLNSLIQKYGTVEWMIVEWWNVQLTDDLVLLIPTLT